MKRILSRLVHLIALVLFYAVPVAWARISVAKSSSGITRVVAGTAHHSSGAYAIVVHFNPVETPWYVYDLLDSLNACSVNAVLVVNHELEPERQEKLSGRCHEILVRNNIGADFGAYKDACLRLIEREDIARLGFINDSIYFFRSGLDAVIKECFYSPEDVISLFENIELHYHFQSFFFSLGPNIFRAERFNQFWRDYLPVNNRRWAINNGEVGLSRIVLGLADSIRVMYGAPQLEQYLQTRPVPELLAMAKRLPLHSRELWYQCVRRIRSLYHGEHTTKVPNAEELLHDELVQSLLEILAMRSQAHQGALLFHEFLGVPVLKRDLVYRGQFHLFELEQLLRRCDHDEQLISRIMTELRKKGYGEHLKGLDRLRYRIGVK